MVRNIESIRYIDPQEAEPAGFCPRCGGELYEPSLRCIGCLGNLP